MNIEARLALTQKLTLIKSYKPRKRKSRRSNKAKRRRIVRTLMRVQ